MTLWRGHFDELRRLHDVVQRRGAERRLLARVFCVVRRYMTLADLKSGTQAALPDATFALLRAEFGVTHELFASPLNLSLIHI